MEMSVDEQLSILWQLWEKIRKTHGDRIFHYNLNLLGDHAHLNGSFDTSRCGLIRHFCIGVYDECDKCKDDHAIGSVSFTEHNNILYKEVDFVSADDLDETIEAAYLNNL